MAFLSNTQISDLCLKLGTLLHAGFDIGRSADLIHYNKNPEMQSIVRNLSDGGDRGEKLHEILKSTGRLPSYVTGLLETGDMAGRTEDALFALSDYYDKQAARARQIKSILLYPAMLMLAMLVIVVLLLTRVLPIFDSVYQSLGGSMTGLAGGLLAFGSLLNTAIPVLCGVLFVILIFAAVFALSPMFRGKLTSRIKKQFGDTGVFRKVTTAQIAQSITMGLQSGLPLESAMALAANLLDDNPKAARRCKDCADKLASDLDLSEALLGSNIFPEDYCELLILGQQGGNADSAMSEIARRLSADADAALDALIAKIEPSIVILASVLIGMILISVMMPLMNIMTAIC